MVDAPTLIVTPTTLLEMSDRAAIVALCTAAFGQDFASLFDLVPPTTMHIRCFHDGRLVGHACWAPRLLQAADGPLLRTAYVDAVATDRDVQGRGIGSAVLGRFAEETSTYTLRALSTSRVSFYTRLGWQRWRGRVAIRTADGLLDTPDDTILVLPSAHTPPLDLDGLLTGEPRGGQHW
ncbi:MAG TPA: GNAT family N-acetyltransferase [Thermomicrobiales bacterium]|jgi:aminoglycoside 2'-N-acetyltransferase I